MPSELSEQGRAHVVRRVEAPAAAVWAALGNGWLYATWVVGASRVRDVDPSWPDVGARIHHSFGLWPAVVNDETVVLESDPKQWLALQAKGWPFGEARVELRIKKSGAHACDVSIVEDAVKGPGTLVPLAVRQPLIDVRNRESLHRLSLIAEGMHRQRLSGH